MEGQTPQQMRQKKNSRLLIILIFSSLFMFGFCYMMVPLYALICQREAINGKAATVPVKQPAGMVIDYSRTIKVTFLAMVHNQLQFTFKPLQTQLTIHPGERKLIYFYAENQTGNEITVQAIPSITPAEAAGYLKKTECFCFTQQYFFSGEKAEMPVYFFIDPAVPSDIKEMTLSYTLFDASAYKTQSRK